MTVIVTLNGPIVWAILGDITQYCAISGRYWKILKYIGIISSSINSVMYWARPIQVVPGQLFFLVNFVWPCWIRYVTILLKTADIGRYR